jgi:V-type H+-transporting ATPase proteolipid subunit
MTSINEREDSFKPVTKLTTDIESSISSFYGFMGIACALVFANLGAAYGTAKSGVGICAMGVMKPSSIIKGVIPVIMAGILGIYGLIVAVILAQKLNGEGILPVKKGYQYLGSGLCCGLTSFAAGIAIGIGGEAGVRALGQQEKIFVGMMLILIFAEALGLYGLIVSLILVQ